MLETQDRILCAHRRLFRDDNTRYFLGTVDDYEAGIVRATGYTFVRDTTSGLVMRKPELRTKLLALQSGLLIMYVLPRTLDIEAVRFEMRDLDIFAVDSMGFELDLSELPRSDRTCE